MNSKNIKRHLNAVVKKWIASVEDESVKKVIKENTIITGGALVSLLTGEPVNDYDIYFKTKDACVAVVKYYVDRWNLEHPNKPVLLETDKGKVSCFIQSEGIAEDEEISSFGEGPGECEDSGIQTESATEQPTDEDTPKYKPRFVTSNAITLTNKIQIITRFFGDVGEIHKNYDFSHCTCAWSSWDNEVFLPQKALECIINKELYYVGSQYPLCSIIRTRKYIKRGYTINAGQYVKMAFQLNALDLTAVNVLEDQLTGVDTTYFQMMVDDLRKHQKETGSTSVDFGYAMELINKLF